MRLAARRRQVARIEMVPLIDVVFLLLVFFTYAMLSMVLPRGMRVKLPAAEGSSRVGREPVAVTIGRRGELYVDREPCGEDDLVAAVKSRLRDEPERWVLVQGDARAPLESAIRVLGRLREGGIDQATFRVAPLAREGAAP
jgi:biopolymer transport protein ExbD